MKDRFDLEVEIMDVYTLRKPLELLAKRVLQEDICSEDVANILLGLASTVDMYSESLYDTMCQVLRIDEYRDEKYDKEYSVDAYI